MSFLASAFGLSGGYNKQKSSQSQTESGSTTNAYSAEQTGLQSELAQYLRQMLGPMAGGEMSPQVAAMKTASADTINRTSAGTGDRLNRLLAARGFGKSGATGKAALSTELGRQGALAGNEASFSGLQLDQGNKLLAAALQAAYEKIGSSYNGSMSGTGTSSGWGIGASAGASFGPPR